MHIGTNHTHSVEQGPSLSPSGHIRDASRLPLHWAYGIATCKVDENRSDGVSAVTWSKAPFESVEISPFLGKSR